MDFNLSEYSIKLQQPLMFLLGMKQLKKNNYSVEHVHQKSYSQEINVTYRNLKMILKLSRQAIASQ